MAQPDLSKIDGSGTTQNEPPADEPRPIMPHLVCSATDLDGLDPPVEAPSDKQLDDLHDDRSDAVYQHGLRLARQISEQTQSEGRRRRPAELSSTTPTSTTTPTACTSSTTASSTTTAPSSNGLKVLLDGALGWAPSPRRSAKLRDAQPYYRGHVSSLPSSSSPFGSLPVLKLCHQASTRPLAPLSLCDSLLMPKLISLCSDPRS